MSALKALAKRVIDGVLRRLGLVRTAVAAAQTVDAIYLSKVGRAPDLHERAEGAAALRAHRLIVSGLIDTLGETAEAKARLWDAALPAFRSAGYVAPRAHFEGLVEIAFLAVFGRAPDAEALGAYEGALRTGHLSTHAFVAELTGAQEATDRILSQGYLNLQGHRAHIVDTVFLAVLGRPPEEAARAAYAEALRSEKLTIERFIAELGGTREAADRIVSAGYFDQERHLRAVIDAVFKAALGRSAEDNALSALVHDIEAGALTLDGAIDELSTGAEAKLRALNLLKPTLRDYGYVSQDDHYGEIANAIFQSIVGRLPEAAARAAYSEALRSEKLTIDHFIAELASTREAADRIVSAGYFDQERHLRAVIDAVFKAALGRPADDEALRAFVHDIAASPLALDDAISELSTSAEAMLRALKLLKPTLKDHGYISEEDHYGEVADAIFQSIFGRPLNDSDHIWSRELIAGNLTIESTIEQFMNSEEVRLRVLHVGLPDVLEGIYRTVMGAPETDPALRSLIRSAASKQTFETIKNMSLSAEARHYIMQPIIKAHRQQFLEAAST